MLKITTHLVLAVMVAVFTLSSTSALALPGCDVSDLPGCGGCACETCVCEMDSYCCEFSWDSLCASECVDECGGCVELLNCGDGDCNPDEFENCKFCPEDCACLPDEEVCFEEACCVLSCDNAECGDNGCGGSCGECGPGQYCTDEALCDDLPPCVIAQPLHCDDVIELDTADYSNLITDYSCVGWNESGPEVGFTFQSAVDDLVKFTIESDFDHDLFLLKDSCLGDSCTNYDGAAIEVQIAVGDHNIVVVDGYSGAEGPFTLTVWCQSTCVKECPDGYCGPDGCKGECGCQSPDAVCFGNECCTPKCAGKQCGSDGCGGQCGDCQGSCLDYLCIESPGCAISDQPGCGGCICEECVCALDPFCCETQWDSLCVSECIDGCGGCEVPDQPDCGDDTCDPEVFENCANCNDCACPEAGVCYEGACCETQCDGENICQSDGCGGLCACPEDGDVCNLGECCTPSCEGKECGSDGCGSLCGECVEGLYCKDDSGLCVEPTCDGACGGNSGGICWCDATCFSGGDCCDDVCDFCLEEFAAECAFIKDCGNGSCDAGTSEDCLNCPDDCTCAEGEACGMLDDVEAGCVWDVCAFEQGDIGCCEGNVINKCINGVPYITECSINGNICGWYPGDWQYLEGYYCGPADLVFPAGDPSGEYPASCSVCEPACGPDEICIDEECVLCEPDCAGKQCGFDGCGGECGTCPDQTSCQGGMCAVAGCEELADAGCGGCPCENCVCDMDPYCCDTQWDGICVEQCIDQCGGCPELEPQCGDNSCNGSEDCLTCAADCACEVGQECVAGVCECAPDCTDKVCGDDGCDGSCGDCEDGFACSDGNCDCIPDCEGLECGNDGCDGSCGECGEGFACMEEACVECTADCDGIECGDDGCNGSCGECEDGFECLAGQCECIPVCDGIECGDDGCEGSCGECEDWDTCIDGICDCTVDCTGLACGDDGCGGSCGECEPGLVCDEARQCVSETSGGDDLVADAANQDTVTTDDTVTPGEEPEPGSSGCTSSSGATPMAGFLFLLMALAIGVVRRFASNRNLS